MEIVSLDDLTKAIMNSPKNQGMSEEEAGILAHHVLNFFGYTDRIIDNVLEPEDRDPFYMLEDADILKNEFETTSLYDGREWRVNYWLFKHEVIDQLINSSNEKKKKAVKEEEEFDYSTITDDMWARRSG